MVTCEINAGQLLYNSTLMKQMLTTAIKCIFLENIIEENLMTFKYLPLEVRNRRSRKTPDSNFSKEVFSQIRVFLNRIKYFSLSARYKTA